MPKSHSASRVHASLIRPSARLWVLWFHLYFYGFWASCISIASPVHPLDKPYILSQLLQATSPLKETTHSLNPGPPLSIPLDCLHSPRKSEALRQPQKEERKRERERAQEWWTAKKQEGKKEVLWLGYRLFSSLWKWDVIEKLPLIRRRDNESSLGCGTRKKRVRKNIERKTKRKKQNGKRRFRVGIKFKGESEAGISVWFFCLMSSFIHEAYCDSTMKKVYLKIKK